MAKAKATKNSADIGFEKQLWDAADVLRGNMDAADYKNVVLGLIFLKYLSDRFDERYQELVAEGYGDEEDRDCYIEENVFYVPEEARWAQIASEAHAPEIGQVIDNAMRAIERENDALKDVLPKNFARPELDKRRLGEVVDLFTNIQMSDGESEKDLLGRAYEYCLSQFASLEGKNAGEFYTPSCIVRTLVEIIQPFHGRVYDPCCGSGGMFVQSAAFVQHRDYPAVPWPRIRSLLWIWRHVRPVRRIRAAPRRQCRPRHHGVRPGKQPQHMEARQDEPRHPGHRSRLG